VTSLDSHTVNMLMCLGYWCGWHWTCNTCNFELTDVPLEKVRLNSENVFLTKINY